MDGMDFDLEEGNIKGVKEQNKGGSGLRIWGAVIIIIVLGALFLWAMSNRNTVYGLLGDVGLGNATEKITTKDYNAGAEGANDANGIAGAAETNAGNEGTAEIASQDLNIGFSAQLISSDYSISVKNADVRIDGEIEGSTSGEKFSYLNGNYLLKNFSGTISTNKGYVELNGKADGIETPIGKITFQGSVSMKMNSGVLGMQDVYLTSFKESVTGSVSTSTIAKIDAQGDFTINGFRGRITLGMDNAVTFEGKTSNLIVKTSNGITNDIK
ncbi:MAG: hypothetical protein WC602_05155 [archaeon]